MGCGYIGDGLNFLSIRTKFARLSCHVFCVCMQAPPEVCLEGTYEDMFNCGHFMDMQILVMRLMNKDLFTYCIFVQRCAHEFLAASLQIQETCSSAIS